ncbi:hypothetical protein [uncultured Parasphingorhabdus sp.]|uniref:hypothetical protein n=1 Tax=uncultured Parasphingorhabdus sp. TaxID=2709694 RepID=UPI0030D7DEF3|tara:strand:- start:4018 stop:4344 length:327 start_codon:yes stop_codon:yes gene_type:complete
MSNLWPIATPENTNNGGWSTSETPALPAVVKTTPTPTAKKPASMRLRLETVRDCRRELKRLFIAARNEEITTQTATRLAYILDLSSRMIERSELEQRIEALEAQGGGK